MFRGMPCPSWNVDFFPLLFPDGFFWSSLPSVSGINGLPLLLSDEILVSAL